MLSKAQPHRESSGITDSKPRLYSRQQTFYISLLQGFKQQTAKWPLQPMQAAAAYLAKHSRKAVVADFGCGDAELASMAPQETVHSLDLVSSAPGVIACNMADTPLGTCLFILMTCCTHSTPAVQCSSDQSA